MSSIVNSIFLSLSAAQEENEIEGKRNHLKKKKRREKRKESLKEKKKKTNEKKDR